MADLSNPIRRSAAPEYPKNTVRAPYNRTATAKIPPQPKPYRGTATPQRPRPAVERPRPTVEHIKPLNPQIKPLNPKVARARVEAATINPKPAASIPQKQKKAKRSKLHDFLLGFFVGLIIFGIAAVIICSVLIGTLL